MTSTLLQPQALSNPFGITEGENLAVITARPDDDALESEAIQTTREDGATLWSITATNGEASDRGDSAFLTNRGRLEENRASWEAQGVPPERQLLLGLPDGKLQEPQVFARLRYAIAQLIARHKITTVITPGEHGIDNHPDHIAIHKGVLAANALLRQQRRKPVRVIGFSDEEPTITLPARTDTKYGLLALHASQFEIQRAEPDQPVPEGWVYRDGFLLSEDTASRLGEGPYPQLLHPTEATETYKQYA